MPPLPDVPPRTDLCLTLSGRSWAWPMTARWLEHQSLPHDRIRLVLLDSSGKPEFTRMVRAWSRSCDYASVVVDVLAPDAVPDLASQDRQNHRAAVRRICASLYARIQEIVAAGEAEAVATLEDDMLPPEDALPRLMVSLGPKALSVSAHYLSRDHLDPVSWTAIREDGSPVFPEAWEGIREVAGHGFGCAVFRRDGFLATPFHTGPPWEDYDFNFFHESAAAGHPLPHVDRRVVCRHYDAPGIWKSTPELAGELRFLDNSSRSLKITHLNHHDTFGGAERVAGELVRLQTEAGHRSILLVSHKHSPLSASVPLTGPWARTRPDAADSSPWAGYPDYIRRETHALTGHPLIREAEVLHLHNLYGWFNPWALPGLSHFRPVVWTLHDLQALSGYCAHSLDCPRWETGCGECPDLTLPGPELARDVTASLWRDKALISAQSRLHLVAVSEWAKARIERSLLGHHPVEVIPNRIDPGIFQPGDKSAARRRWGIPDGVPVIGGCASGGALTHPWKGGDHAVAALEAVRRQFPDLIYLNIGGDAGSSVPGVIGTGRLEAPSDVAQAMNAMDLLLFPSLAETAPLSTLEAMGCGVPVAAFRVGGIPEQVTDGLTGQLADPGDTGGLTQILRTLLADSPLRLRMGQAARARITEHFDFRRTAEQYETLYRRLAVRGLEEQASSQLFYQLLRSEQQRLEAERKLKAVRAKRTGDQAKFEKQWRTVFSQPWLARLVRLRLAPRAFRLWWQKNQPGP